MTDVRDALLRCYRRELGYLRAAGAQFAAQYPKIAERLQLGEECADPHTERLIESFAFLTARIQHQLDNELPEVSSALLGVLHPHFIEPIPSCSIAHFDVDLARGLPMSGHRIGRHTPLFASATGQPGLTCSFRTAYPVTLWPLEVTDVQVESTRSHPVLARWRRATAVLRIGLRAVKASFAQLELDTLRIFLHGEPQLSLALYELLTCHAIGLVVAPHGRPESAVLRPPEAIVPVGLEPGENLLPDVPGAHRGYRLLQEYLAFPAKFLFFDLALGNTAVRAATDRLDVFVLLDAAPRDLAPTRDTIRLGCTPIVNLFRRTSEPIRIDHRELEYRLIADARREPTTEIHSIESVTASATRGDPAGRVEPFFAFHHPADGEHRSFWHARRQPTLRTDAPGTDLYLSFLDLDFHPSEPADQILHAHVLCTNRDLAARLPEGAALQIEAAAPLRKIQCLLRPTAQVQPPLAGKSLWRLISHLSLDHLSLVEGPEGLAALQELLRLYAMAPNAGAEAQIRGITGVAAREVLRRAGSDAWRGFCRGLEVRLTVDASRFVGSSAVLLSAVLARFFSIYASTGSFIELVLLAEQREGVWKRWPAMAGEQKLL